jgi:CO/xanthine dehydrogenase FAD-binding subunit
VRAAKAEALLAGEKLSGDLFVVAAQAAAEEVRPAMRPAHSRSYLRQCIETLCRDGLDAARGRIGNGRALPI